MTKPHDLDSFIYDHDERFIEFLCDNAPYDHFSAILKAFNVEIDEWPFKGKELLKLMLFQKAIIDRFDTEEMRTKFIESFRDYEVDLWNENNWSL